MSFSLSPAGTKEDVVSIIAKVFDDAKLFGAPVAEFETVKSALINIADRAGDGNHVRMAAFGHFDQGGNGYGRIDFELGKEALDADGVLKSSDLPIALRFGANAVNVPTRTDRDVEIEAVMDRVKSQLLPVAAGDEDIHGTIDRVLAERLNDQKDVEDALANVQTLTSQLIEEKAMCADAVKQVGDLELQLKDALAKVGEDGTTIAGLEAQVKELLAKLDAQGTQV